jgi:histone H3/H4
VIASRLKNFIKQAHDLNCSDGVLEPLSEEVRRLAGRAARNAAEDGRKTILERDFDFLKR